MTLNTDYFSTRLIAPVINLNGETIESHMEKTEKALDALLGAIEAFRALAPHGRDFQTQPNPELSLKLAQEGYRIRLKVLMEIRDNIQSLGVAILQQKKG